MYSELKCVSVGNAMSNCQHVAKALLVLHNTVAGQRPETHNLRETCSYNNE